jgi:hypothetical protein
MKFLLPNYRLPPEPLTRGLPPPDPRSVCPMSSTEFVETPPPLNKMPGYATVLICHTRHNWYLSSSWQDLDPLTCSGFIIKSFFFLLYSYVINLSGNFFSTWWVYFFMWGSYQALAQPQMWRTKIFCPVLLSCQCLFQVQWTPPGLLNGMGINEY